MPDPTIPPERTLPPPTEPVAPGMIVARAGDTFPDPTGCGRFRLLGELARGGMGVVYRADDPLLGREVAVKMIRGAVVPAAAQARFVEEARITGRLQHPGIPPVYDLGTTADGRPYLAMKLIRGETLADRLAGRENPAADRGRFVAAFEQLCQAVGYAHSQGVIHRDLKPANVMVGAFGEVQVMDWGLAKETRNSDRGMRIEIGPQTAVAAAESHGADSTRTEFGSMLGTPAFMPPEQAAGRLDEVGPPADVFGLGAILCVVLTGKPPYVGASALAVREMALAANLTDAFARLDASGAESGIVSLCKRCLAADPNRRPAAAGAVAAHIADLRTAAEEMVRQAEIARARSEVRERERRRRRRTWAVLATVAGVLSAVIGYQVWSAGRQADQRRAEIARDEAVRRAKAEQSVAAAEAALTAGRYDETDLRLTQAAEHLGDTPADDLRTRAESAGRELALVRSLDKAVAIRWALPFNTKPAPAAAGEAYRAAYATGGFAVGTDAAITVGEKVKASRVSGRLIAGLDAWLEADPSQPGLAAVLATADPDEFRTKVRTALAAQDLPAIIRFAESADGSKLPPTFAATLGSPTVLPPAVAVKLLARAVAAYPDSHPLVQSAGAAVFLATNDGTQALGYLRAAVALKPTNLRSRLMLSIALMTTDPVAALAEAEAAVKLGTGQPRPLVNLGNQRSRSGLPEAAAEAYSKAIELAPASDQAAEAHAGLGDLAFYRGDYAVARDRYAAALALLPKYALARSSLGDAKEALGDLPGALADFRGATEVQPENGYYRYRYGLALLQRRKLDEAATECRTSLDRDPKMWETYALLRNALSEAGRLTEAKAVSATYLARMPAGDSHRSSAEYADRRLATVLALPMADPATPPTEYLALLRRAERAAADGRFAAAAKWYTRAFARGESATPDVDPSQGYRMDAARAAARAAAGQGKEPAPPADRPALAAVAVNLLDREIAEWVAATDAKASTPAARLAAASRARFLLTDPDFVALADRLNPAVKRLTAPPK